MSWQPFHHPDISWPVIRRRAQVEFVELLECCLRLPTRSLWSILGDHCYPSQAAYKTAVSRMKKQGLLVNRSRRGETPHLILTDEAKCRIPVYFQPEKLWDRAWHKRWHMIIYDVPEADRGYRNTLRKFLERKRMGCLQKSVWITPDDIRPDFDDLCQTANIDAFAYLFESKTVLGMPACRIVENAWDFDQLETIQQHYCLVTEKNLALLKTGRHSPADLMRLLRLSVDGYHAAMRKDPLLPRTLQPAGYLGEKAFHNHQTLMSALEHQIGNYI